MIQSDTEMMDEGESRGARVLRAVTWSAILGAAVGFWTMVGVAVLAYLRP